MKRRWEPGGSEWDWYAMLAEIAMKGFVQPTHHVSPSIAFKAGVDVTIHVLQEMARRGDIPWKAASRTLKPPA